MSSWGLQGAQGPVAARTRHNTRLGGGGSVPTHRGRVATKEGKKDFLDFRKSLTFLVSSGEVNIVKEGTKVSELVRSGDNRRISKLSRIQLILPSFRDPLNIPGQIT